MSVEKGRSAKAVFRKCATRFCRLFPHLLLCLSLVAYAALGALMFEYIEGGSTSTIQQEEYHDFLGLIVNSVQNHSNNASYTHQDIVTQVENVMRGFKSVWFQAPERWTFFGAMFFCCTVFTTVVPPSQWSCSCEQNRRAYPLLSIQRPARERMNR